MNPFSTVYDAKNFCDRAKELLLLKSNIKNGLNTMLHSPRRLGKTALIFHLFHALEKEKLSDTIYIDLFASSSMDDLITSLANKVLKKYYTLNVIKGLNSVLKGLKATVTIGHDGNPQVSFNLNENQHKQSLDQIFSFLERKKKKVVIAFDEFQEVAHYPEKAEAELRSYMQTLQNVKFIFSGSSNHLLTEMFQSPKRPFYQSTEVLTLSKIDREVYARFISHTFKDHRVTIDGDAVEKILNYTDVHTYYTQVICNHCYAKTEKHLTLDKVTKIIEEHQEGRKLDYQSMLNLLPPNQKRILIAIAKEEVVAQPTSMAFLTEHKLPSASSSMQAVNGLLEKEIIYKTSEGLIVYDVFFKRFLQIWH